MAERTPRKRGRRSARQAGSRFERQIADYLRDHIDDRIDRRVTNGNKDRGDIGGMRLSPALGGGRIAAECKNLARLSLAACHAEAETARGNDDAIAALLVHKRHGVSDPGMQWVTCTVNDLVALLTGHRPPEQCGEGGLAKEGGGGSAKRREAASPSALAPTQSARASPYSTMP